MNEITVWRVNLLRAGYLLLIVGLGLTVWPSIFDPARNWAPDRGIIVAMLGALSLLALVGLRHPLRMLPLLLWEIAWKTIWLTRIALPLWTGGRFDAATAETTMECLMAILIVAVIPWDYVLLAYVRGPGAYWRRQVARR
jgi:hypothetical protein